MPIFLYHAPKKGAFNHYRPDSIWAGSTAEIFNNPTSVLSQIPENSRYDFYLQLADTKTPRTKDASGKWAAENWIKQDLLTVDIDGLTSEDLKRAEAYSEAVAKIFKCEPHEMTIVRSGHGFHFHFWLKTPITDWQFFRKFKPLYLQVLTLLDTELATRGLSGKCDPAVFDHARVMRLPGTENRKREPFTSCELLQLNLKQHEFTLGGLLGVPDLPSEHNLSLEETKFYLRSLDAPAIRAECAFLAHYLDHPHEVKEPTGYALLSILSRFDDTGSAAREAYRTWTGSTSLQSTDPDLKIQQALTASGPRTCQGIEALSEEAGRLCRACPHYGKLKSPVQIQSSDFIATEKTGFYRMQQVLDAEGKPTGALKRGRHVPHDVQKKLDQTEHYKVVTNKMLKRWKDDYYQDWSELQMRSRFEELYSPKPDKEGIIHDTWGVCSRYNVIEPNWFETSTSGFMNLKNGVFELATGVLHKHDPQWGFTLKLPFDFDPSARAPRFEKFLTEVVEPEQVTLLLEFLGFCLSGDANYPQKAMVFWGDPASGKSTICRLLNHMLGTANCTSLTMDQIKSPVFVNELFKSHVNISGETPSKSMLDSSDFNRVVGQDFITANPKYLKPYSFICRAKMIFNCNELPISHDSTTAFYRRLWIIRFIANFDPLRGGKEPDPTLEPEMFLELSGIFNLCMAAYQGVKARGGKFTHSALSTQIIQDLREDNDIIGSWLKDNLVNHSPTEWLTNGEIWQKFEACMRASGNEPLLKNYSNQSFQRKVKAAFPTARKDHKNHVRGLWGLKFISSEEKGPAQKLEV